MWKIKKEVLEASCNAAKNLHPREFFALLGVKRKKDLLEELVIVPAVYGESYSLIKQYLLPFDQKVKGSIHSHPSHNARPSQGDLATFAKLGVIHFIACVPYDLNNVKAFNVKGKEISFELV